MILLELQAHYWVYLIFWGRQTFICNHTLWCNNVELFFLSTMTFWKCLDMDHSLFSNRLRSNLCATKFWKGYLIQRTVGIGANVCFMLRTSCIGYHCPASKWPSFCWVRLLVYVKLGIYASYVDESFHKYHPTEKWSLRPHLACVISDWQSCADS